MFNLLGILSLHNILGSSYMPFLTEIQCGSGAEHDQKFSTNAIVFAQRTPRKFYDQIPSTYIYTKVRKLIENLMKLETNTHVPTQHKLNGLESS